MELLVPLDPSPLAPWTTRLVDGLRMVDVRDADADRMERLAGVVRDFQSRKELASQRATEALDRDGVLDMMMSVRAARPDSAFAADFLDLERLYRLTRARRPELVLEFGSGWSTFVLAQALVDNGSGHLVSVEAEEAWASSNRRAMPRHLAERCSLLHCRPQVSTHGPIPVFVHEGVPDCVPDLVYLDGPALFPAVRASADILRLERALRPGAAIVVDGRHDNVIFLASQLARRWSIRSEGLRCLSRDTHVVDAVTHASVLVLEA